MCFSDVLDVLRAEGININGTQLRWAISSGKIDRPQMDRSLRFVFDQEQVEALKDYFRNRSVRGRRVRGVEAEG